MLAALFLNPQLPLSY